jgi:hypothetical protein
MRGWTYGREHCQMLVYVVIILSRLFNQIKETSWYDPAQQSRRLITKLKAMVLFSRGKQIKQSKKQKSSVVSYSLPS